MLSYGRLAQLGERPLDVRKVTGSSPASSIFCCSKRNKVRYGIEESAPGMGSRTELPPGKESRTGLPKGDRGQDPGSGYALKWFFHKNQEGQFGMVYSELFLLYGRIRLLKAQKLTVTLFCEVAVKASLTGGYSVLISQEYRDETKAGIAGSRLKVRVRQDEAVSVTGSASGRT